MRLVFALGIGLMNRMRYGYKFGLISLIFVLPITVLIYFLVTEVNAGIAFAQKERTGVWAEQATAICCSTSGAGMSG